jgi:hypothetical protein
VKKRIFTVQGYVLGNIRFCIGKDGEVRLEGNEDDLKHANTFWLKDQDWLDLWEHVYAIAPAVSKLRCVRVATCCCAGTIAVGTVVLASFLFASGHQTQASQATTVGLVMAVLLFAIAGITGCIAHRRAKRMAEELGEHLNGLAECTALWPEEGSDMLVIEVQQLASEKSTKASQMPIGSSKRELSTPPKGSKKLMGGG